MPPLLSLRNYRQELIAHSHAHPQLVISLTGHLEFEMQGRGSELRQQHLLVIRADAHHTCVSAQGSQCLVLDIPDDHWLTQNLGEHADASRRLLETSAHHTLNLHQQQLANWLAGSSLNDPLIERQGAALLLASLNNPSDAPAPGKRLPFAAFDALIRRNAAYPLQVADLAKVAGLSSASLHRRFIGECGQTPMDYIRQRRLRHALNLLRQTSLAIGEVASRCGYASQSAFSAAMLREFGASPSALRREPRDN